MRQMKWAENSGQRESREEAGVPDGETRGAEEKSGVRERKGGGDTLAFHFLVFK